MWCLLLNHTQSTFWSLLTCFSPCLIMLFLSTVAYVFFMPITPLTLPSLSAVSNTMAMFCSLLWESFSYLSQALLSRGDISVSLLLCVFSPQEAPRREAKPNQNPKSKIWNHRHFFSFWTKTRKNGRTGWKQSCIWLGYRRSQNLLYVPWENACMILFST